LPSHNFLTSLRGSYHFSGAPLANLAIQAGMEIEPGQSRSRQRHLKTLGEKGELARVRTLLDGVQG
jgi:hypothetical protein